MKSKLAQGKWSLRTPRNLKLVDALLAKHSRRWGLRVLSRANVGNHLHLQVRVPSRRAYVNFIRAFSAAVAMGVTGFSRWERPEKGFKFWDHRPFTRIVSAGFRPLRILRDYLRVNQLEGQGWSRDLARMIVREELPLLI